LSKPGFAALVSYVIVQVLLPTRPWFYPGNPSWHEEGHQFSWHMMLRSKEGNPTFYAVSSDGKRSIVNPLSYITKRQLSRIRGRPDLIHQFALFVADDYEHQGKPRPMILVDIKVGLNGRPAQPLIDPSVDLAARPRTLGHAEWLMPAREGPPGVPTN
jgi:hypothetical protein